MKRSNRLISAWSDVTQRWGKQIESVDLRYDGQIIVNPDLNGMARQPVLTPAAAKAAMAAGVKTAALVNYEKYVTHPTTPPAPAKKEVKPKVKAAVHHAPAKGAPAKLAAAKTIPVKAVAIKPAPAKPAPASQAPPKPSGNTPRVSVSATSNTPTPHLAPAATAVTAKKPSAAIPKESPQN